MISMFPVFLCLLGGIYPLFWAYPPFPIFLLRSKANLI